MKRFTAVAAVTIALIATMLIPVETPARIAGVPVVGAEAACAAGATDCDLWEEACFACIYDDTMNGMFACITCFELSEECGNPPDPEPGTPVNPGNPGKPSIPGKPCDDEPGENPCDSGGG
ncbi:MAG: hypothetical protein F4164_05655 [Gemmatimonadales bacterium]|nr:hypothetical protein [Gemmatimonadales bacterium]MYG48855.1 hypothetical protein [Gemmatimonadales bacterium]MYK03100.1 hypothetical protein [Candidatus Palauibacter ramosifaciens]